MVRKDETILFQEVSALNAFVGWLTDWTERWGCWDYLRSVLKYSAKSDCMNTSAKLSAKRGGACIFQLYPLLVQFYVNQLQGAWR